MDRGDCHFVKMEATGNDYVYFIALDSEHLPQFTGDEIALISNRRFGVGGDGVVVIGPSARAAARMHMWNSDGSASRMCGNALRSVALLVYGRTGQDQFLLESGSGIHRTRILHSDSPTHAIVEVEMGPPVFESARVPFLSQGVVDSASARDLSARGLPLANVELDVESYGMVRCTILSMGNPHCVVFVDDVKNAPVEKLGPLLEKHPAFPERTNVEFVSFDAEGGIQQRTYERGAGETLSCGSGACAVLVATVIARGGEKKRTIRLLGGELEVEWTGNSSDPGTVYLRGPAHIVYRGSFRMEELKGPGK